MKKCPTCKSISPDEETTCGVCGESLEHVAPMTETLDQSILEDKLEESAAERQFVREERKVDAVKLSVGLSVGLGVLASGIILITYGGLALGVIFLPIGLWIIVSVSLGGLGPSAWHRLFDYRVVRIPWSWIHSEESEEEDKREKNEKAENIEARNESDKSRREREESGFD